jgi:hypothetical protein
VTKNVLLATLIISIVPNVEDSTDQDKIVFVIFHHMNIINSLIAYNNVLKILIKTQLQEHVIFA